MAADESSAANEEQVDDEPAGLARQADHVAIDRIFGDDLLAFEAARNGPHAIAKRRRPLKFEGFGRRLHLISQAFDDLALFAVEKLDHFAHALGVVALAHGADAGAEAAAQLILEAGAAFVVMRGELAVSAGAQLEVAFEEAQRFADGGRRAVGTEEADFAALAPGTDLGEIALKGGQVADFAIGADELDALDAPGGALRLNGACHFQSRPLVTQIEAEADKALVVAQQHVEARAEALDELAFEDQRLLLGAHDDDFELVEHRVEEGDKGPVVAVRPEVAAHARAQVDRLADVDDLARGVFHQIDAGLGGEVVDACAQFRSHGIRLKAPSWPRRSKQFGLTADSPKGPNRVGVSWAGAKTKSPDASL